MEIIVTYRCMFTGRQDTVVLSGRLAKRYCDSAYKSNLIEQLETVDSTSVQVISESYDSDEC